jgi:hypothetical protein
MKIAGSSCNWRRSADALIAHRRKAFSGLSQNRTLCIPHGGRREESSFAIAGRKIAAFSASDVEATRRNTENPMAGEINARGGKGIAAYSILGSDCPATI